MLYAFLWAVEARKILVQRLYRMLPRLPGKNVSSVFLAISPRAFFFLKSFVMFLGHCLSLRLCYVVGSVRTLRFYFANAVRLDNPVRPNHTNFCADIHAHPFARGFNLCISTICSARLSCPISMYNLPTFFLYLCHMRLAGPAQKQKYYQRVSRIFYY